MRQPESDHTEGHTRGVGPERLNRAQREHLDRLIDAVLDGAAPQDALGRADAPGQAWRELAMLRMTTERLCEPIEVPQQTEAILAAIHRKRTFLPKQVLGQISAARVAVAAGLLVALGLYAFTERAGLGTQIRGDVEPLTRLTASTQHDASRVMDALRSFNEQTTVQARASMPQTTLLADRIELHPRTVSQPMGIVDRSDSSEVSLASAKGGLHLGGLNAIVGMGESIQASTLYAQLSAMADMVRSEFASSRYAVDGQMGRSAASSVEQIPVRSVRVRGPISAGDPFASSDQAFAGRVVVTVSPSSGTVIQVNSGSLEAWSMMTSRQLANLSRPQPIVVGSPSPDARSFEPLR